MDLWVLPFGITFRNIVEDSGKVNENVCPANHAQNQARGYST